MMPFKRCLSSRASECVVGLDPLAIGAARYLVDPARMVQIPLDGLAHAGLEGFLRRPAELGAQLGAVDRVAAVVAGAVLHEGDLLGVGAPLLWTVLVERGAERPDNV